MKEIKNIDSLSSPNKQFISTYGEKFNKIYQNPLTFKFLIDEVEVSVEKLILETFDRIEKSENNIEGIKSSIKDLKKALQEYINTQKEVDRLISESVDLLNNKYEKMLSKIEKLEDKTKFI